MATTGNRDWAWRRAAAVSGPCSIYQHKRNKDDYIVRTAEAAPPNPGDWRRIATFQPDGTQSFTNDARGAP